MANNRRHMTVNITTPTILRTIFWVIVAITVFHFIHKLTHALTILFISFFFAMALNPVVSWMGTHLGLKSRVKAVAAAYLTVVLVLTAFFALVIPPLVRQTRDFINDVPSIVQSFQTQDTSLARAARRYHVDERLNQAAHDVTSRYSNFGSAILDTGKRVLGIFISALAVLVLTFMMLVEGPRWIDLILGVVAPDKRDRHRRLVRKMYHAVSGFVNGQVILAGIAGVCSCIALLIASNVIGVSINAVALAGIVAVFGLIPLFGNPISSATVILICLLQSSALAVVMLVYFAIYYQIENLTLQPYIQSRTNELTPLLVFSAALLGISIGGFLGAIVAIPAASTIKILIEDYFDHRHKQPAPTEDLKV